MKVLALTDSLAPWHSFWIRFGQYATALPWATTISGNVAAIEELGSGDRLLFYRYALEWGDLAARLQAARQRGVLIFSDLDDYLWQANGWTRERLVGCTRALRHCHAISCSTRPLLEQLNVMFPGVSLVLLPNTAPQLEAATAASIAPEPNQPLRIGWTGAPWTRPGDLALLRPLANWVAQRPEQLRLVHVGHGQGHLGLADALGLPSDLVEAHPLQGHGSYLQNLRFDIGLAPLAMSSFNHYKSAIKLIEYSTLGIPWLASDVQPYRELCDQWQWCGRLCSSPEDWIEQLQPLLEPLRRRAEGMILQRLCQQHASYDSGVEGWTRLLSANHWSSPRA